MNSEKGFFHWLGKLLPRRTTTQKFAPLAQKRAGGIAGKRPTGLLRATQKVLRATQKVTKRPQRTSIKDQCQSPVLFVRVVEKMFEPEIT